MKPYQQQYHSTASNPCSFSVTRSSSPFSWQPNKALITQHLHSKQMFLFLVVWLSAVPQEIPHQQPN
jgi:hypothetical protein